MILVTGGAGYIGSHCALSLLKLGYNVIVFDNLSTGNLTAIDSLKEVGNIEFFHGDLTNSENLKDLFAKYNIESVIHFAALSSVGESVQNPSKYYYNNVLGTINLLDTMIKNGVNKIIFSSTAAIYGEPKYLPIDENHPKNPINPYGKSKMIIEEILDDYDKSYGLKSVRLRYFNVVGANSENIIGEMHDPETHLVPCILNSIYEKDSKFEIYGQDYNTQDGTCIRDYVNVEDLVNAHILALKYLDEHKTTSCFNIGTSKGNSVKEVFSCCEKVLQKNIVIDIKPRRIGDPAQLIADNKKAKEILGWYPTKTLKESIESAYKWTQKRNGLVHNV